jgi:hypothetical protein
MPPTRWEREEKERVRDKTVHDSAPAGSQEEPKNGVTKYEGNFFRIKGILGTDKMDKVLEGPEK